ncbi:unnamed protein product, partial [Penicillium nalgiovense]
YDLDLDLHAIWHEPSDIPTPPPCLATDPNDLWQDCLATMTLPNTKLKSLP